MIKINWKQDYRDEFICPYCNALSMKYNSKINNNQDNIEQVRFYCPQCHKTCKAPHFININPVLDPTNEGVVWYRNYRIKEFICPHCDAKDIYFGGIEQRCHKKIFRCKTCSKQYLESLSLNTRHIARRSRANIPVKSFNFQEDKWDLRAINPNFNSRDLPHSSANFTNIKQEWLRQEIKKYIYHLCKSEKSFSLIKGRMIAFRSFANYLNKISINGFHQINRSLIVDYLAKEKIVNKSKLGSLRDFFITGTIKGWFIISQDIIRDEDFPKKPRGNPDPISDKVREQIESNLHKLPDPIARMWIVCYFTAMRPGELAFLKQDCLVQEGEHWKIVWNREKTNDYHEVPISRTIAKVIQEQQEYIQNLWGNDWEYLFCQYHGLSSESLSKIKLEPIKKVIHQNRSPLLACIRCLIQDLELRDENGQPAKFQAKILRATRLTQLFEQGHDLALVSAWAGHKHFATTSNYYTEVSCDLMEKEAGHIQQALVNSHGHRLPYESFPKSFWENPTAHKLELSGTHINTPIYGYCGLPLEQRCDKFRACYTCVNFVATPEKLPQYIKTRDELRAKESKVLASGQDVLVEQFGSQADQLDKIIASLQEAA